MRALKLFALLLLFALPVYAAAPAGPVQDTAVTANFAVAVTKSDSVNLTYAFRALWIGSGGDVVVVMQDGSAITFKNCADGSMLPVRGIRVNSTGTTASDIVALY